MKKVLLRQFSLFTVFIILLGSFGDALANKGVVSLQAIDGIWGVGAKNEPVIVEYTSSLSNPDWTVVHETTTNSNGEAYHLVLQDDLQVGCYRIKLITSANIIPVSPEVTVVFRVDDNDYSHHFTFLLNVYSYAVVKQCLAIPA